LVRRAKEQADAAGVPMEPFTMDAAAELDRAIAAAKK
jgi:biotin carboxylase